jgi:hypothetical protein
MTMATISSGRALAHGLPLSPLAILFAVTLYGGELASQPGGTVKGSVAAADKMAIPQARVRVVGTTLAAVTQADGTFEVTRVPAGPGTVEVMMIGYTPQRIAIVITPGETLDLKFSLDPVPLETVTVTADPNFFAGMGAFQERKARGMGHYFTRDDIARMQPRQLTDVLRRVPGMQIASGREAFSGGNPTAQSGRNISGSGSHPCAMTYYVNGSPFPLSGDISINHYVAADDVAAIEVYTGSSQIPPEFNSSIYGSRCGVIAIWTRSSLGTATR